MSNQNTIRVMPHNDEAERSTLGAALIDNRIMDELMGQLTAESFYRESHRHIWRGMVTLHGRREAIDVITLSDQLKAEGLLEAVGGPKVLARLSSEVPSSANVNWYAQIIARKAALRTFISTAHALIDGAYGDVQDFDEWTDAAAGQILPILQGQQAAGGLTAPKSALRGFFKEIETAYAARGESDTGQINTPFDSLNGLLYRRRFAPQDLVVIAARPSVGKTAFALQIALHNAHRGIPTAFFSLEMGAAQLAGRLIACEARCDVGRLMEGNAGDHEWRRVMDASVKLEGLPLWIDERPALTVYQIKAALRSVTSKQGGPKLVVIDYLQLLRYHDDKTRLSREAQLTWIAQELKNTAKELDVTIIALAQLNREVDKRGGKPRNSDLRESGGIEQAADIIGFLWREDLKGDESARPERAEVFCGLGKNRHGQIGDVSLEYRGAHYRFEDRNAREDDR